LTNTFCAALQTMVRVAAAVMVSKNLTKWPSCSFYLFSDVRRLNYALFNSTNSLGSCGALGKKYQNLEVFCAIVILISFTARGDEYQRTKVELICLPS
jgi:hypothetical protein